METDPELKDLLKENIELAEENNRMLKYVYRSARLSTVVSIIKWVIIIGVAIGAFYLFQPIYNKFDTIYQYVTNSKLPDFMQLFKK